VAIGKWREGWGERFAFGSIQSREMGKIESDYDYDNDYDSE
jgi:hypothetical protein